MKQICSLILATGFLGGCASTKRPCPSVEEESVSLCRANRACMPSGFLGNLGLILGGGSVVDACVDRNLSAQRLNAGIKSNSATCYSEKIGDRVKTVCRED